MSLATALMKVSMEDLMNCIEKNCSFFRSKSPMNLNQIKPPCGGFFAIARSDLQSDRIELGICNPLFMR
jgi:hypothetical protein